MQGDRWGNTEPGISLSIRRRRRPIAWRLSWTAAVLAACAAPAGPGYREEAARQQLAGDHVRVVVMRPRDRDDGGNGGRAVVRIDGELEGAVAYGGYFFVDRPVGPFTLEASGRYATLGTCELQIEARPGATVFLDLGPRLAYQLAGLAGSTAGALAGAAAVPQSVITLEQVIFNSGTAAMAAGAVAGEAAAVAVVGRRRPCGGPYQLDPLAEAQALERLDGLGWSR